MVARTVLIAAFFAGTLSFTACKSRPIAKDNVETAAPSTGKTEGQPMPPPTEPLDAGSGDSGMTPQQAKSPLEGYSPDDLIG